MSISLQGHPFPKDTEPSDVPKEQAEKIKAVETTGFKFVGWKTEDSPDEDDQYYHGIAILRKGSNTFMAVFPDGDSGLVRDEHAMESGENSEKIAYDVDEAVAAPPDEKKVDGLGMIAFVGPKNKAKAKQTKNYGHITSAEDYIDALKKIGIEAKPTDWVVYFPESRARLGGGKMKSIDEMLAKLQQKHEEDVDEAKISMPQVIDQITRSLDDLAEAEDPHTSVDALRDIISAVAGGLVKLGEKKSAAALSKIAMEIQPSEEPAVATSKESTSFTNI